GRPPLSIGLFVEAEILGARLERAVVLPRSALRSGNQVLVVDSDSRLRYRPVEVVRRAGDEAVIGAGLEAGDRVCLSPLEAAFDGMAVRINEAETGS
ncbi:MAG: efflux transporter periplasmic adaptor subunit, partial [Myxococcota bacterium]